MKTQTSIRLSEATRAKLDKLTAKHGTATEVIALAIDRLGEEMEEGISYYAIVKNDHFQNLTRFLREAASQKWQSAHAGANVGYQIDKLLNSLRKLPTNIDRAEALSIFTCLLSSIAEADPELAYTTHDMEWLVSIHDLPPTEVKAVVFLMAAYWSCES